MLPTIENNNNTIIFDNNNNNNDNNDNNDHKIHPLNSTCWNTYQAIQYRSLYGRRLFGRKIHVSGKSLLQQFQCNKEQIFYFYFPDLKSCTPFACDYANSANHGNLLAVSDEEGRVSVIRTDKSNKTLDGEYHSTFYCHSNTVVDVKWSKDDTMLLTSGADYKVRIMDVETQFCLATFVGHRAILRSSNWHPTDPHLFVSACKDGSFQLWDTRSRQIAISTEENYKEGEQIDGVDLTEYPIYGPVKVVNDAHVEPNSKFKKQRSSYKITADRTVTCALFHPKEEEKIISSGSFDGSIKLWDCRAGRTPSPIQMTTFQKDGRRRGISDMKLDHNGTRLFSLCMDNSIYMHNLLDISKPVHKYTDPNYDASLFTIKLSISYDDQFLLAGSSNNNIYAWEVDGNRQEAHVFKGHTNSVSGVVWHKSSNNEFSSCSDDFKVRIWKKELLS
ncbi:unnamed protein product [Cunninghamella echinulata]